MELEPQPARVERHTLASTVRVGRGGERIDFGDGTNHVSGEVTIEVSGAASDRPHTYELLEALESAVEATIEDLDGGVE